MKKAFTLVELLVVIGIIGILSAVLLVATSGVGDRAKAVKCKANLKSVATSVNSYLMSGSYPFAQSALKLTTDVKAGGTGVRYYVNKGWVSWLDMGVKYPTSSDQGYTQPSYAGDTIQVTYALTNGALWKASGGRHDIYLCPAHVSACQKAGVESPGWSYQMNAFFGYQDFADPIYANSLKNAEQRLLFAEIPALKLTSKITAKTGVTALPDVTLNGGSGDKAMDGCLRYKSSGGSESIGFNHLQGKQVMGHVVFADGHVEALAAPKNGNYLDLTDWLCLGKNVVFANGSYEKIDMSTYRSSDD